jgi:hypothetical protein
MHYSVWITTPSAQEAEEIAVQATAVASAKFHFAIRETFGSDLSNTLVFYVDSEEGVEDATARALDAYTLCRVEAGLGPDENPVTQIAVGPQLD